MEGIKSEVNWRLQQARDSPNIGMESMPGQGVAGYPGRVLLAQNEPKLSEQCFRAGGTATRVSTFRTPMWEQADSPGLRGTVCARKD